MSGLLKGAFSLTGTAFSSVGKIFYGDKTPNQPKGTEADAKAKAASQSTLSAQQSSSASSSSSTTISSTVTTVSTNNSSSASKVDSVANPSKTVEQETKSRFDAEAELKLIKSHDNFRKGNREDVKKQLPNKIGAFLLCEEKGAILCMIVTQEYEVDNYVVKEKEIVVTAITTTNEGIESMNEQNLTESCQIHTDKFPDFKSFVSFIDAQAKILIDDKRKRDEEQKATQRRRTKTTS